jgi:hypothetical protein
MAECETGAGVPSDRLGTAIVMKLTTLSVFSTMLLSGIAAAAEPVATLDVLQGRVLVNLGQGFVPATKGELVQAGDMILVHEGSAAILASSETGCVLALRNVGTYRVPNLAECGSGHAAVMDNNFKVIPANGYPEPIELPPPMPGHGVSPVLIGVGFFGVSIAAAAYASFGQKNHPVSTP